MKDILSKEEINALLHNTSEDIITNETNKPQDNSEKTTEKDLNPAHDKSIYEKYPMLYLVNERFTGLFQSRLSKLLACELEIMLDKIFSAKFSDYTHSLFIPTSMNIAHIKPLNDIGIFVFGPKLVFMLVDKYFGGEGKQFRVNEGREFAPTELRVIEMILEKLFVIFTEAWSPVTSLQPEFSSSEVSPQTTGILNSDDTVFVTTLQVDIDGTVGELHVVLPGSILDSLKNLSETSR